MKSAYITSALVLLLTAGFAFAQFAPPNVLPPSGNVPPPINVGPTTQIKKGGLIIDPAGSASALTTGNLFEVKGGNVYVKNGRLISDSNSSASNPTWTPNGIFSSLFSIDTNAPISSNGVYSTEKIYSVTDLYSANLIPATTTSGYASIPAQIPLCSEKTTGKLIRCGTTTSTGGGGTPTNPTGTTPAIAITNTSTGKLTGQGNSLGVISVETQSGSVSDTQFSWATTGADRCWISGPWLPLNAAPNFISGSTTTETVSGVQQISILCKNNTSGNIALAQKTVKVGHSLIGFYPPSGSFSKNDPPLELLVDTSYPGGTYCKKYIKRTPSLNTSAFVVEPWAPSAYPANLGNYSYERTWWNRAEGEDVWTSKWLPHASKTYFIPPNAGLNPSSGSSSLILGLRCYNESHPTYNSPSTPKTVYWVANYQ